MYVQKRQNDIGRNGGAAAGKKVVRFDLSQGVDMEESEDIDDTSDGGDDDNDEDDDEEEEEEKEEEIVREPMKPETYVSPHRREGSDAKGRTLERLRRQVQGLINRLAWRQFFHCNSNI